MEDGADGRAPLWMEDVFFGLRHAYDSLVKEFKLVEFPEDAKAMAG